MFARGVDFAILQTDVLDEIKRNPRFPGVEQVPAIRDEALRSRASCAGRSGTSSRSKISKKKGQFRAA